MLPDGGLKSKKAFILVMQYPCLSFTLACISGEIYETMPTVCPEAGCFSPVPQRRSGSCLKWCPCCSECTHPTEDLLMGSTQGASKEDPKWPKALQHCLAPYFAFSSYVFWHRLTKQGPLLLAHSFPRLGFVGVVDPWLPCVKN